MKLLYLLEGYLMILIYFIGIDTCKDVKNGKNYDVLIKANLKHTLEFDRLFKQYWTVCHFIYWLIIVFIQSYSQDRYMIISLGLGPMGNMILLSICHYLIYKKIKELEIRDGHLKSINNNDCIFKNNKFNVKLFWMPVIFLICAIILNATLYNLMLSIKTFVNNGKSIIENILYVYNNSNIFYQVIMFPLISLGIVMIFCIISKIIISKNRDLYNSLIPSTLFMLSISTIAILEFFNIYNIKGEIPQILVSMIVICILISLPLIRFYIGIYIYINKKRLGYDKISCSQNFEILNRKNYFKDSLYYNSKNMALMLENANGLSLQVNFANPKVKYIILIIILSSICAIGTMISNKVY